MTSITTRAGKGSPLTHNEVDANFTNLNNDKLDTAGIALGSAASPTLKFTGDPNTGIYSPGADQLAVSTGGTGRLFVDASGNVGIGTSSPQETLTVNGSIDNLIGSGGVLRLYELTTPRSNHLIAGADATGAYIDSTYSTGGSGALVFRTISNERARIDSSGLVGIGTSSPTATTQVEIVKSSSTAWAANTIDDLCRVYNSNTATNNSSSIYSAYCNYGDGTFTGARFGAVSTGSYSAAFVTALRDSDGAFKERFRISAGGNVGIGTTSPTTLLDVNTDTVRVRTARTPASASATGATGEICWDANYIYVCTATNTWKRSALSTW